MISILFCYAFVWIRSLMPCDRKGLTSWFSFVMSNSEVVTFPLVFWSGVVLDCIAS